MAEVRFYHLTRMPLEAALPTMLRRTLERGQRAVVMAGSEDRVEALNGLLWAQDRDGFLPHGSARDGFADEQPIWLTCRAENPNGAQVLLLTDGAVREDLAEFALCAILFDGRDAEAVAAARALWQRLKDAGHALSYWQQEERGGWRQAG